MAYALLALALAWCAAMAWNMYEEATACGGTFCGILQDVVLKSPDKPRGHLNLGVALKRHGRVNEALREFDKTAELMKTTTDLGSIAFNIGAAADSNWAAVMTDAGLLDKARDRLVNSSFKRNATWYANMAVITLRMGRYEEAVALADAGLALPDGDKSPIWFNRGEAEFMMRRCGEAMRSYAEARKLNRLDNFPERKCE